MSVHRLLCTFVCLLLLQVNAAADQLLFTLRIENRQGGTIQAKTYRGEFVTIGKVTRPATDAIQTFPAAAYVAPSCVAATAVHGIRIRVPSSRPAPAGISIQPMEYDRIPTGYGGHIPGRSAIFTDIRAGDLIFRQLAPLVGDMVMLEVSGAQKALPVDWKPSAGDVILIESYEADDPVSEFVFHNTRGGSVETVYHSGRREQVGTVKLPVEGIGRFDGTAYTGIGAINTNHGGIITISTAPNVRPVDEGAPPESRGGFVIQPAQHSKTQPPMPQMMVVEPLGPGQSLEGMKPLFAQMVALGDGSPVAHYRTGNQSWTDFPAMTGKVDNALSRQPQAFDTGTTVQMDWLKITRPKRTVADLTQLLEIAKQNVISTDTTTIGTRLDWTLSMPYPPGSAYVMFESSGRVVGISNIQPFGITLDGINVDATIRATFMDASGRTLTHRSAIVKREKGLLKVVETLP